MKPKALLLTTVFIDVIGLGIIIPVLPFYVRSFGVSDAVVTILFTLYALLSFFSAPFLGALSDRIGRRPVLVVSILSSAIGWLFFAGAKSIVMLFIGRIIDGLAAGNITTAQSALADLARDDKERTVNMGLFGALFGIGFIVGPALGGLLSAWGTSTPFWFVGILALLNTVFAYFFLPETHAQKNPHKKLSYNPLLPIRDALKTTHMRKLFLSWFLFGVAIAMQQSSFSVYMSHAFGFSAKGIGLLFTGIGVLILINQTVLLRRVWLRLGSNAFVAQIMLVLFALGMILQAVPMIAALFVGMVLATFGQGTIRSVYGGLIANANESKRGEYLGVSTSLMSLAMVIGPLIATAFIVRHPSMPFLIAGGVAFCIYFLNIRQKIKERVQ